MSSKLRVIAAGAAAGLAGAVLMGQLHKLTSKMNGHAPKGEDATAKVAKIVTRAATRKDLPYSKRPMGGQIVHYAFGAGMGALYALIADSFPGACVGAGTLFGAAVYAGAHAAAVPALGLAPSPMRNGVKQESAELAGHLAYGAVTEGVRRLLA
jgi:putative membrane protein